MSNERRGLRGVVITEDRRTERFVRHILDTAGFSIRRFRFLTAPAGRGAGEAWVLRQYPLEVNSLRKRRHQRLCLVAIRDGDAVGVEHRKAQLDGALAQAQLDARRPDERIATPVPTWAIENWLLDLLGHPDINEARKPASEGPTWKEVFEHQYGDDERAALIEAAARWREAPARLQSLEDGRLELERIEQ